MLESLLSNRTVSVLWEALPRILSAGLTMTIPLTLVSFTLAMVLAVAVALVQYARVPVLSQLARFYIWVIRGTPLLVQLFIIFYGLPSVGIMLDAFPAAVIAFAFNEGAYCAETMRGALESVPQGQLEAGCCVGMSWWQIMRRIVLPQALRTAVPALSNSLIGMIKDTSLASNITVAELFMPASGSRPAPTSSCPSTARWLWCICCSVPSSPSCRGCWSASSTPTASSKKGVWLLWQC